MILRPAARGPLRGREPVQARRPLRGQPARARGDGRGLRAAPALRVARARASSRTAGCKLVRRLRRLRRRAALQPSPASASPTRRRASAARCSRASSSRGSARCSAPRARRSAPIGTCMVSLRGRLRRLLQLRPLRAGAGSGLSVLARLATASSESSGSSRPPGPSARSSATSASRWPTAPAARRPQRSIEGLLAPAFGDRGARRRRRRHVDGDAGAHHRRFVVKPLRFPGGSIGELAVNGTVNDLAMAGARPLALTLSPDPRGGPRRRRRCAPRSRRSRARPRRPASQIVGRRHEGRRARPRRRDVHHARPGSAGVDPRAALSPAALRPGDRDPALRPDRRARHRDHARPRRVRARRRRSSPTRARCGRRSTRCSTPPGRRCAACATRPAAASPPCSTSSRARPAWRCSCARRPCRSRPRSPAPAELLGIDPMYVANEGKLVAFVAPEAADAALAALRAVPGCERAAEIGEVQDRAARHGARGDRASAAGG